MTACVSEKSLVAITAGEGSAAERAHVGACRRCAARAAALEDDLRLVRETLVDGPLPVTVRSDRWSWAPLAGALAATAVLTLVWSARTATPPRTPSDAPLAALAGDVSVALFDAPQRTAASRVPDSAYLQAALDGGWPCGEAGLYGVDCGAAETVAFYTD